MSKPKKMSGQKKNRLSRANTLAHQAQHGARPIGTAGGENQAGGATTGIHGEGFTVDSYGRGFSEDGTHVPAWDPQ